MNSHDMETTIIVTQAMIILGQIIQTWIGHQRGKTVDNNVQTVKEAIQQVQVTADAVQATVQNGGTHK